ncbi:MAG: glucose 1-dehydrogenase [Chloroflexota bacterium]|nr:MAG: glucose 1-dehydrogenase [Chloroflexota bacterium]
MKLQGKVAVITGAGSGMGQAAALLFSAEGCRVMVADINGDSARETVRLIKEGGGEGSFVQTDVSEVTELQRMISKTIDTYGRLDILFNHAGIAGPNGLEEIDEKQWQKSIDVNLKSGFFATKYAVAEMRRTGGGSIIFTSSIAGLMGSRHSAIYSATKGGIIVEVKALALQLAPDNIRVNCICPGFTDTQMLPDFFGKVADFQAALRLTLTQIPLARLAQPEDIAKAALFLASDDSSYITGVTLPVDGGYTVRVAKTN